jgi:hypothetical protein
MSKGTMNDVLEALENIKNFPSKNPIKDLTRMTIIGGKEKTMEEGIEVRLNSFTLGLAKAYDKKNLVPSAYNRRFPELHILLKKLMKEKDPSFKYTSITINKNVKSSWHIDKYNIGKSYGLSLGNFSGGGVEIKYKGGNKVLDTHNKLILFDGHLEHKTLPYRGGNRYAITFFKKQSGK